MPVIQDIDKFFYILSTIWIHVMANSDEEAVVIFQRKMVSPIAEKFMPIYDKYKGQHGYVSI